MRSAAHDNLPFGVDLSKSEHYSTIKTYK